MGKWDRRIFASPGSHRKWLLEEYRCCHCFLLLFSLKSGLTRGMPFTITAMPVSQFMTCNCLKRKLKREEGEEGVSCYTFGIETQGQKPNASPTRVTAF